MPAVKTHRPPPAPMGSHQEFRQGPLSFLVFVLFQVLAEQYVGIVGRTGTQKSDLTTLLVGDSW